MDTVGLWARMETYFSFVWGAFLSVLTSPTAMGLLIAQSVVVVVCVFWAFMLYKMLTFPSRKTSFQVTAFKDQVKSELMPKDAEHTRLNGIISDILIDNVEDLYARHKISLEQKDYIYEKVGKAINSKYMLEFARASKREQIKRRISTAYKPVKLPSPEKVKTAFKWATGRILKRAK